MSNKNKQKTQAPKETPKPAAEPVENLFDEPEAPAQEEVSSSSDSTETSDEGAPDVLPTTEQKPAAEPVEDEEESEEEVEEPRWEDFESEEEIRDPAHHGLRKVGVHPVSLKHVYRKAIES